MIKQPISQSLQIILGITSVVLLIGAYSFLSYHQHQINPKDTTIPSIVQIAKAAVKTVSLDNWNDIQKTPNTPENQTYLTVLKKKGSRWLIDDSKASLSRLVYGMGTGVFISCLLGILMGCFPYIEYFCIPPLSFLTRLPVTAMLAVFFVLVGTGENVYLTIIAFGIIPSLTLSIYQAAKFDVHEESIHKAYTLGASTCEVIYNVVLRQILPRIIESVRLQIGPALVYLIASEFIIGNIGFGYRLRKQSAISHMDVVYAYLIFLGLFGFLADQSLTLLRKSVCPWFNRGR